MGSTAVTVKGLTVLQACRRVLRTHRSRGSLARTVSGLTPTEIARKGVEMSVFEVPRGRTFGYLSQLVQSTLYNEAHYRGGSVYHSCGLYYFES